MIDGGNAALLDAVLDAAADAIVVANAGGTILRANRAAAILFRHPLATLHGAHLKTLMPMDMAVRHDGFVAHYLETGERRIIGIGRDVIGLRGDGTEFPVHLSVGRTDIDGVPIFVGILHDQTRRRAAEDALTRSQRMDAIGQMTGGVAHDFNNLLTVVIGNLELLEMGNTDARIGELIADALSAAELGADLTSRLLIFSRKGELRPVSLNLGDAVEDVLRLLKRTLSARCRIELRADPATWPVELDPVQLKTAIINLALNAQDAMPHGGRLRLAVENMSIDDDYVTHDAEILPGRYVRLTVSDTGTGMTPEQRHRALEPFYTTKPAGKGTGLGLSMVYGYVRQSGGYLTLYSEEGRGTAISLYFPLAAGTRITPERPDSVPVQEAFGQGYRVLVVEDDPAVRRLSMTRLSTLGFDCVGAIDAGDAWSILESRDDIQIVFSDLVMPGVLTGEDLAARIHDRKPDIGILLTSGFSGGMMNPEGIEGLPRLLRKPYRQADLVSAFRRLVSGFSDSR